MIEFAISLLGLDPPTRTRGGERGERGEESGQGEGARERQAPPHSYHRRWVILYMDLKNKINKYTLRDRKGKYWSGGAEPVHGLRIVLREGGAGWAALSSVRSSVRPSVRSFVTPKKGPKGLRNH